MRWVLAVCLLLAALPSYGNGGNEDPICPKPGKNNLFAPDCNRLPDMWIVIVEDAMNNAVMGKRFDTEKRDAEVGFFVRYLRNDLARCKKGPEFVGETEESLQKYERAYARSKEAAKRKRAPVKKK